MLRHRQVKLIGISIFFLLVLIIPMHRWYFNSIFDILKISIRYQEQEWFEYINFPTKLACLFLSRLVIRNAFKNNSEKNNHFHPLIKRLHQKLSTIDTIASLRSERNHETRRDRSKNRRSFNKSPPSPLRLRRGEDRASSISVRGSNRFRPVIGMNYWNEVNARHVAVAAADRNRSAAWRESANVERSTDETRPRDLELRDKDAIHPVTRTLWTSASHQAKWNHDTRAYARVSIDRSFA